MRFSHTTSISSVHRSAADHAGPSAAHCNARRRRTWSRGHGHRAAVSRPERERAAQPAVRVDHAASQLSQRSIGSSTPPQARLWSSWKLLPPSLSSTRTTRILCLRRPRGWPPRRTVTSSIWRSTARGSSPGAPWTARACCWTGRASRPLRQSPGPSPADEEPGRIHPGVAGAPTGVQDGRRSEAPRRFAEAGGQGGRAGAGPE